MCDWQGDASSTTKSFACVCRDTWESENHSLQHTHLMLVKLALTSSAYNNRHLGISLLNCRRSKCFTYVILREDPEENFHSLFEQRHFHKVSEMFSWNISLQITENRGNYKLVCYKTFMVYTVCMQF